MTDTDKCVLVIPFSRPVIEKAEGFRVAVRSNNLDDAGRIARAVGCDRLHCIEVSAGSMAGIRIRDEWRKLPLIFRLKSAGRFLDYAPALEELRDSAARFYFPASPENISAARVLSSLMIKTGLEICNGEVDWEAMEDLLVYDSCGRSAHSSVEPFLYSYTEYKNMQADYNELYLEKEGVFFHCDAEGNIALSGGALERKEFVGTLNKKEEVDFSGLSLAAREKRRARLLEFGGCSICPGWRVCGFRDGGLVAVCPRKQFMTALVNSSGEVNKNAHDNF